MVKVNKLLEQAEKELEKSRETGQITQRNIKLFNNLIYQQSKLEEQNAELIESRAELLQRYIKYFELYDDAPVGYFTLDINRVISNVNIIGAKLLQLKKEEIIGQGFINFIYERDKNKFYNYIGNAIDTRKKQDLELQLKRNNTLFYAYMRIMPLDYTSKDNFRIIITDISERKKAEEKTKRILGNIAESYVEYDNEWRYVDMNSKFEETFSLKRNEIIDRVVWKVLPQAVGSLQYNEFYRAKKENIPVSFESQSNLTGEWFEVHAFPHPEGLSVYLHNINDRKNAEEALRENEEKYRLIVETAQEGIVIANPEGPYILVNQKMVDMLGYTKKEILGKSSTHFMCAEDQREQVMHARKDLAKESISGEFKFCRKDGSVLWTSYNASPFFDDKGNHIGNLALHTDITERKKAEEELRASLEDAKEKSFKLDAIMEYAPDGITITGGPPNFPIENINKKGLELTGSPPEELLGLETGKHQRAWKLFLPDGRVPKKTDMPLYRASRLGETVNNVEFLMKNVFGENIPLLVSAAPIRDDEGNIIAAINIWHDIREIKKAEEKLNRKQ